MFRNGPFSKRL